MLFSSMLRAWVTILLCVCIRTAEAQAALFPGDQSTQIRNGKEIWVTGGITPRAKETVYFVRDYGVLRPKLVYNCHIVGSLCKSAAAYLGAGVTTGTFHFDMLQKRRDARREGTGCTERWIESHTCPEPDQPNWWFTHEGVTAVGPLQAVLSQRGDVPNRSRLGWTEIEYHDDKPPTEQWYSFGAGFSCEEFPAASWIEGGPARGTLNPKAAATYCAPMANSCEGGNDPPPKLRPNYDMDIVTDQNWQGSGILGIRNWVKKLWKLGKNPGGIYGFSIYKFDFEMITDKNSKSAVWVEANGVVRYCYGLPGMGSCSSDLLRTDPPPNNDKIEF